jgi:hypothetical protein
MMSDFDFIFCLLPIFIYGPFAELKQNIIWSAYPIRNSDFITNIMGHISAGHIELRLTAGINRLD